MSRQPTGPGYTCLGILILLGIFWVYWVLDSYLVDEKLMLPDLPGFAVKIVIFVLFWSLMGLLVKIGQKLG